MNLSKVAVLTIWMTHVMGKVEQCDSDRNEGDANDEKRRQNRSSGENRLPAWKSIISKEEKSINVGKLVFVRGITFVA